MPAAQAAQHLVLDAAAAADLMSPGPVSVNQNDPLTEVVALMTVKGFHAAPVIDEAGRAVGVVSRSDLIIHQGETAPAAERAPVKVADVMTPVVFSVTPTMSACKVIEQMVQLKVHQLYVVDDAQVLVGVVTALDVLRRLHP